MKPFTADDVHRSLAMAEDVMRGRETFRQRMPENLTFYEIQSGNGGDPEPGFTATRPSLKTRLEQWLAGAHG